MVKKIGLGFLILVALGAVFAYLSYSEFRSERLQLIEAGSQVAQTRLGPIEYHMAGEGETVLFIHGTPGGYDQSADPDNNRVLTPSRPGYLRTPLEIGRTPAEQAHAYAALLDELDIDRVYVMGASGGGPSSIAFAAAYPERTIGLILLEAISRRMPDGTDEPPAWFMTDFGMWAALSLMTSEGDEAIVQTLIPDPANQQMIIDDPEKLAGMQGLVWSMWPPSRRMAGTDNDIEQFRSLPDLGLASIRVPTLIIHGTADVSVPLAQGEHAAEQIPGAVLHVIEGADHMMPFTHSEELDITITKFVESIQGGE